MNNKEWKSHFAKANTYKSTKRVKSMWTYGFPDYEIEAGDAISTDQLLCVILYCDTNKLQCEFSKTFRKQNPFDTVENIKQRHRRYYWFARRLIETIHCFGINNSSKKNPGPFFCGLSRLLTIAQFTIYLRAPLSTSKDIEIAVRFATEDGIILTLDNEKYPQNRNNMIDCSWISRYAEENERLWIGYPMMEPLRITRIRRVENNEFVLELLLLFDVIVTGSDRITKLKKEAVNEKDSSIFAALTDIIDMEQNQMQSHQAINPFVMDCFALYCLNTTNITLRMKDIDNILAKKCKCNVSFLFHDLQQFAKDDHKMNLLNPKLLSLCRNVRHVTIDTHEGKYKFDLSAFSDVISKNSQRIKYEITGFTKRDIVCRIAWEYLSKSWMIISNLWEEKIVIKADRRNYKPLNNYEIWLFDILTSDTNKWFVANKDVLILKRMIDINLSKRDKDDIKQNDPAINIIQDFASYCDNKQKMVLNMEHVHLLFDKNNGCDPSFLFNNLDALKRDQHPSEKDNLLNPNLLSLFKHLKYVQIDTFGGRFKFDMLAFLDIINNNSRDIQYEIDGLYEQVIKNYNASYNSKGWNMIHQPDHDGIVRWKIRIFNTS